MLRLLLWIDTLTWLVIVVVKCLRRIATNIRLQRAIHRQRAFDDPDGLKEKAAAAFRLCPERISVVAADFIPSPVSYGVLRKTILLPYDYGDRYSQSELYLLLLHEMGHIKNHDTVKLQLLDVAACFIWSTSLMKKQFIRDSEILCDNRILGVMQGEQDAYAELMVRECSDKRAVRGLAFSDSYHTIKSRLDAIYSRRPETHRVAALALAILLLLAASSVYASRHPATWLKTATEEEPYLFFDGTFEVDVACYDADSDDIVYTLRPSPVYVSTYRQGLWGETSGWMEQGIRSYTLSLSELEQAGAEDRYARFNTSRATWEELVYNFIAHWL